jgi:CubicO group peptidase (beta-lactamase class C family)
LRKRALEEYIQETMRDKHIPGVSMAISHSGKVIYAKGFGFRDLENREAVTPETIFGTASVTKSFTGMAIMKLEEEGILSVHDPVTKYLPEWKLEEVEDMENIRIAHLLSHTTGLPPLSRREELNQFCEHIYYLNGEKVEMLGKPGEYFSYCNDSFLLLGAIIERVTGKLFRRYLTESILVPLQMNRSTFSLEEVEKFHNVSVPYEYNTKSETYVKQEWPTLGNYEVGGGIRSNVLDLLTYGEQYITETPIVAREHLQEMWQPFIRVHDDTYYGYALTTTNYSHGLTLVEHGGGQPGVSSYFGFVPEKKLVVAVLTNVSGAPSSDLWLAGVNAVLDFPIKQTRREDTSYNGNLDSRIDGDYHSAEGGSITIKNGTTITIEEATYRLQPTGKDSFISEQNIPLRFFYKNQSDHPWAVLFGFRMLRRIGE